MCIMVGGTSEPNTTKLIHVPVSVNNSDYNLMIYTNNLSLSNSNKWSSIRDFGLNNNNVKIDNSLILNNNLSYDNDRNIQNLLNSTFKNYEYLF